jgi:RNA polymerase sigma factor (TIGR02999 family)
VTQDKGLTRDTVNASGGSDADDLVEQVYARLRRIAARIMQSERPGHTLWPTEVVHEAVVRAIETFADPRTASGAAQQDQIVEMIFHLSRVMRQVLVDHARHRNAVKRGRGRARVSLDQLDDLEAAIESPQFDWTLLDRALDELAGHDPRRHKVVTLRFFAGLDNRQIARRLRLDERTVGRDWASARMWLKKRFAQEKDEG